MAVNLSVRLDDAQEDVLDDLVGTVASYYEGLGLDQAKNVTRSSALRDLLMAWHRGRIDQFTRVE